MIIHFLIQAIFLMYTQKIRDRFNKLLKTDINLTLLRYIFYIIFLVFPNFRF